MNIEEMKRERSKEWIADAVCYMIMIGVYAQDEIYDCLCLAETLWDNSENEDYPEDSWLSAEYAVDEEMSYWGE